MNGYRDGSLATSYQVIVKGRQQDIDCDSVLYAVHVLPLVSRLSLPQSVLRLQTLHGGCGCVHSHACDSACAWLVLQG